MRPDFRVLSVLVALILLAGCQPQEKINAPTFDGQRAYQHVVTQMDFGPRVPGSVEHEQVRLWLVEELTRAGWITEIYQGEFNGRAFYNILATRNEKGDRTGSSWVLLGAHYDTRAMSDKDKDPYLRMSPVPGANDGASGVAVLLELAYALPMLKSIDVSIAFFDMEDGGGIPGGEWIVGSTYFVEGLEKLPDAVVIVDMIGDADQNVYFEKSSDADLQKEIWGIAAGLGIETFIPEEKYHILDDHTPFLVRGVPGVDLIDFDYPYWHTSQDTLDKISSQSLQNVGDILLEWLIWKDAQP